MIISNYRFQITDKNYRLQITNFRLKEDNLHFEMCNLKSEIKI